MILIFEQDVRNHGGGRFSWKPYRFVGRWRGRKTCRIGWGMWSLSYYPSPGLRAFFEHVESGNTEWSAPPAPVLDEHRAPSPGTTGEATCEGLSDD